MQNLKVKQGDPDHAIIYMADSYSVVAITEMHNDDAKEIARRIVACVNACEGIENDELDAVSYATLLESHGRYQAQRDELLDALKRLGVNLPDGPCYNAVLEAIAKAQS